MSRDYSKTPGFDSGQARAEFGCITTWENADGKRLVLHRQGAPTKGVVEAHDIAVGLDPTFRMICYSTPATIYTDLQGARMGPTRLTDEFTPIAPVRPETQILGRIKRMEWLHPRLIASKRNR